MIAFSYIAQPENSKYTQKDRLSDAEISVKFDTNSANMHHKVFIIDDELVITGSMNPSKNGDFRNDENIIILHNPDLAQKYLDEFETDKEHVRKISIKCKKCGGTFVLKLKTLKLVAKSTKDNEEEPLSMGLVYALDEDDNNLGHIGYF